MAEIISTSLFNDASLVNYWRFEGNSNDSKGSNNGTDTNITYSISNGKFGQGAGFNGSSSKIAISNTLVSSNFTVTAWVKFTSNPSGETSIWRTFDYSGSDNYAGVALDINTSGNALIMSGKNTGRNQAIDWQRAVGGTALNDGSFHNIVGTWDGSNLNIYVDGKTDATPVPWTNAPDMSAGGIVPVMGQQRDSADRFYNGSMDDVAYFKRALSLSEIQSIYLGFGGAGIFPAFF